MLKKVLIANRGEIALRIVRACAEMGIRSVAIYTEPDRYALHVKRADESYSLGEDPLAGYLDPLRIVNLAVETGCDAIHPAMAFCQRMPNSRVCVKNTMSPSLVLPQPLSRKWAIKRLLVTVCARPKSLLRQDRKVIWRVLKRH